MGRGTGRSKQARVKRVMDERAPKIVENPKKALILRGTKASEPVRKALHDLVRRPWSTPMGGVMGPCGRRASRTDPLVASRAGQVEGPALRPDAEEERHCAIPGPVLL